MITINTDPIIFSLGHFALRWYSLIVLGAISLGVWVTTREAERKGFRKEDVYDNVIWVILGGILGARLFHVIDHWHLFSANPIRALFVWEGGLAIWGGVFGGLLSVSILAWRRGWHLPRLLDMVAPGLVLGQGIGRLACIITGDAMGQPTTGPFGFAYTSPRAMVPQLGVYYAPTPVYESLINLAIFFLLWRLRRRSLPDGLLTLAYLTLYSAGRFAVAYTSSYRVVLAGLTQSQVISLVTLLIVTPLSWYLWKNRATAASFGEARQG